MRPEFSAVPFEDPEKAESNLARLGQQLAPTLMVPLASLLTHSPNPDGAVNLLERYAAGAPPDVLGGLAQHPTALAYLVAIFGYSGFLAETLLGEPGLVLQFARDRNFTKLKSKEDLLQDYARFATTNPDPWRASQLARFKRRNYLRIVLKDLLGISTLGETTLELSTLADVILTDALLYCDLELETRYGQPQYRDRQERIVRSGFSVISLGKLGGSELNYSSDIDLLFLYSRDGETTGGSERDSVISNKEYFVRLAHAVTRTVAQATPQGQVFRVDLRLRPEGEQGDLAISLKSALEYYAHRARDWELQMLIKARHSAGDPRLTREFLRGVEPQIYGSPGDFAAVESVLWAREKTSKKLREGHAQAIDVKRHRGGIRDIEFLAQCLQRLHGRQDPWVRSGGTLFALRKLNDKGWISDRDYAQLTTTYEFLRKVEHRIQLEKGQQTHRLPADSRALDRLARRVGVECRAEEAPGAALLRHLQFGFACVDEIYQRVVHPHAALPPGAAFELKPLSAAVSDLGNASYESTLAFLDVHAPELARLVREVAVPERGRKKVSRLFAAVLATSERFALLREKPECWRRALEVVGASEFLAELLIHNPGDLPVLDFSGPSTAGAESTPLLGEGWELPADSGSYPWAWETGVGMREKMALLRKHYRARVLELGGEDLAFGGPAFAVLNRWSRAAQRGVATALSIAQVALEKQSPFAPSSSRPFVVLGLGRLGLNEFDLASDADVVFVVASPAAADEMSYWTRLAEKTIEVLSSYTRDGTLFAVDTRLRPRGQEGELVMTQEALLNYMAENAEVWEALTYLKAFPVAGDLELGRETVSRLVGVALDRFSEDPGLEKELHVMRRRLEKEVTAPRTNTKTAPGGYYDVDYCVSLLRLRSRLVTPPGANMAEQITALNTAGLMARDDASTLAAGAGFLRSVQHAVRLVTGKAPGGLPEHGGHAEAVENLARRWGLLAGAETLDQRLRDTQQQVRYVYQRLVGSE